MISLVLGYVGYLRYKEGHEDLNQYILATLALIFLDILTITLTYNLAVR